MPDTTLEAIRTWGPRCYACGELATYRSPPIQLVGNWWVFTNGTLTKKEFIAEGVAERMVQFVEVRAQIWSRALEDLGFPYKITYMELPDWIDRSHYYYCENHLQPGVEALPYRDLINGVSVKASRPEYPTRYERVLTQARGHQ